MNQLLVFLFFGVLLVFGIVVARSVFLEQWALKRRAPRTREGAIDTVIEFSLMVGALGFLLMFVLLALDLPPQIAVVMIMIGLVGVLIGLGSIVIESLLGGRRRVHTPPPRAPDHAPSAFIPPSGVERPLTALDMLAASKRARFPDEDVEEGPTASLFPDKSPPPRRSIWADLPSFGALLMWFFLFPPVGGVLMVVDCRARSIADWEYWAGFVVPFYGMVKFAVCD